MKTITVFLLLTSALFAQDSRIAFRLSIATVVASQAMDTVSSVGHVERNPLLSDHGNFTARSAGIKLGISGAMLAAEFPLIRKHPSLRRPFTIGNFLISGFTAGIAVRNWRN